jgi:hypothetical protein
VEKVTAGKISVHVHHKNDTFVTTNNLQRNRVTQKGVIDIKGKLKLQNIFLKEWIIYRR